MYLCIERKRESESECIDMRICGFQVQVSGGSVRWQEQETYLKPQELLARWRPSLSHIGRCY